MAKAIVPCQSCGALGELDTVCPFCGTTIQRTIESDESFTRIINRSTVSAQVFAERVAKYQHVESFKKPGVAVVRIGDLHGIINRNGNILVPIQYAYIEIVSDSEVGCWAFLDDGEDVKLLNLSSGHLVNWSTSSKQQSSWPGRFSGYSIISGIDDQIIIIERFEKNDKEETYDSSGRWYKDTTIIENYYEVFDLKNDKGVFKGFGFIQRAWGNLLYEVTDFIYRHEDVVLGSLSMNLITGTTVYGSLITAAGEKFTNVRLLKYQSSTCKTEDPDEVILYLTYDGDIDLEFHSQFLDDKIGLSNGLIDEDELINDDEEPDSDVRLRVSDNYFQFDPKRDSEEQTADLIDFIGLEKEKILQKINSFKIEQEGTDTSNNPMNSGSSISINPLTLIVIGVFLIIGILFFLLGSW